MQQCLPSKLKEKGKTELQIFCLRTAFYLPTDCLQIYTVWVTYLHCTSVCIFVVGLQTCLTRLFAKVQYAQIISEEGLSFLCIALFKRYFFHFLSNNTLVRNIWVFSPLVPSKREKNILVLLS